MDTLCNCRTKHFKLCPTCPDTDRTPIRSQTDRTPVRSRTDRTPGRNQSRTQQRSHNTLTISPVSVVSNLATRPRTDLHKPQSTSRFKAKPLCKSRTTSRTKSTARVKVTDTVTSKPLQCKTATIEPQNLDQEQGTYRTETSPNTFLRRTSPSLGLHQPDTHVQSRV